MNSKKPDAASAQPSNQRKKPVYTLASYGKSTEQKLVNSHAASTTTMSLAVRDRRHNDEADAKTLQENIIAFCRQERIHFVDDQFPPTNLSIGIMQSLDIRTLQWLRIAQIAPSSHADLRRSWSVYSQPEPSDIQQGTLGDCWLMAGLALITERPEMLDHILLTKTVNQEGVYLVRLCHNGLWKTVLVDDCFPCTGYKQLAFTQANRRQLYVPLIEKACAKLFGSYADLISGQTEEGMQLLTGAPCDHINLHPAHSTVDGDLIWAKLLSACESQLLIGVSTGRSDVSADEYARMRLHGNHAFSVLAAHAIPSISMQFVLVRDPHARSNYHDELLSADVAHKLNSNYGKQVSSGAFWISWPKFLRFFNSIIISSYASDYYDVREVARFTRSSSQAIPTFHFHLPRTSLVNISLLYHRENRRIRNQHTQSFVLCNVEQGAQKEVGTSHASICSTRGGFGHWIGSLRAGFYVLIPFSTSFWKDENVSVQDYTLVLHSKVQTDVQVINEPPTLLADCLIATVLKNKIKVNRGHDYNYYVTSQEYAFNICIVENLSATHYLQVQTDLDESKHIRSSRQSFFTRDNVPPRHRQITFLVEWANNQGQGARMHYTYKSQHCHHAEESLPNINIHRSDFHSFRPF